MYELLDGGSGCPWDGETYETLDEAQEAMREYIGDVDFEDSTWDGEASWVVLAEDGGDDEYCYRIVEVDNAS